MSNKRNRQKQQKTIPGRVRKRKATSPVKIDTSYPAYRRLASALYAANYTADVDTVVLKSAFYLVLPMRVWTDNQEHYAPCEVIKIFIKEE